MKDFKYSDHWPILYFDFKLSHITGAMECGIDLFFIGSFGGFGGNLLYVHSSLDEAIKHTKEMNKEKTGPPLMVYRMKMTLENDCLEKET